MIWAFQRTLHHIMLMFWHWENWFWSLNNIICEIPTIDIEFKCLLLLSMKSLQSLQTNWMYLQNQYIVIMTSIERTYYVLCTWSIQRIFWSLILTCFFVSENFCSRYKIDHWNWERREYLLTFKLHLISCNTKKQYHSNFRINFFSAKTSTAYGEVCVGKFK